MRLHPGGRDIEDQRASASHGGVQRLLPCDDDRGHEGEPCGSRGAARGHRGRAARDRRLRIQRKATAGAEQL